jgi:hypothetical protein
LEGKNRAEQSAMVRVPQAWSEARQQTAIAELRAIAELPADVPVDVMECSAATELEIIFVGCWDELIDHVAKHGRRSGDPAPAA